MKMAEDCTGARSSLGTRPSHAVSSSETRQGETMFVVQDAIHVGGGKDMKSHHSNDLMMFQRQESWMQATRIVLQTKS